MPNIKYYTVLKKSAFYVKSKIFLPFYDFPCNNNKIITSIPIYFFLICTYTYFIFYAFLT